MEENQAVMSKLQLPPDIPSFVFGQELLGLDLYFPESGSISLLGNGRGREDSSFI